ncbi:hypothetical protein LTR78_000596 [Recurvomyces mirabilis]|uniref:Uncharacterized protein n=1 Tax=Recurvomyces mirabilis TaxID=574656 RepID=A0AAE0WY72_9PEZI|nr:hypothetical protein LTR78_000596 [Recurvomyces mirabilis]KAK5162250.1 hypothetical protein LTS14_000597 [Recurvomyces mirabilis]
METLKAVVGFGKKEQEGQEPVSGVQGEGSGVEPYDAGNSAESELGGKAPQHTDATPAIDQPSVTHATPADETTSSGKSEAPAHAPEPALASTATTSPPSTSETSKANNSETNSKPSIGSPGWFMTALPLGKRKPEEKAVGQPAATDHEGASNAVQTETGMAAGAGAVAGAGAAAGVAHEKHEANQTSIGLPPNHLGSDVPAAPEAELAVAPVHEGATSNTATAVPETQHITPATTGVATTAQDDVTDQATQSAAQPATNTTTTTITKGNEVPDKSGGLFSNPFGSNKREDMAVPQTPKQAQQGTPKQKEPREMHGSNPSAIPTAGGVPLGAAASEDRRKSRDVRRSMSVQPDDIPEADERTAANTAANADVGMSSKFVEGTPATAEAPTIAGAEHQSAGIVGAGATSNVPASSATSSSATPEKLGSPEAGEEKHRKRSIFSKVKEKIKH